MHDQLAKRGLTVITVDLDTDDGDIDRAASFLKSKNILLTNVVLAEDKQREPWLGAKGFSGIPYLEIYDRQGSLKKTILGGNKEELEHAVEQLLKS